MTNNEAMPENISSPPAYLLGGAPSVLRGVQRLFRDMNLVSLSEMPLANGRTFQVAYNGATTEKPPRFKVTASISKPDGVGFNQLADFTAEPGKKVHVGGFAYQNGSLVLAIRILP